MKLSNIIRVCDDLFISSPEKISTIIVAIHNYAHLFNDQSGITSMLGKRLLLWSIIHDRITEVQILIDCGVYYDDLEIKYAKNMG